MAFRCVRAVVLSLVVVALAGGGASTGLAATPVGITHVVLIVEENHDYAAALSGMPYLRSLATAYASASNYWAIGFPSNPNYMALTSGQPTPSADCLPSATCRSTSPSIFGQTAGSWHVLAESMPSACYLQDTTLYVPRHTAAPYYAGLAGCSSLDIPYSASTAPKIGAKFTLITPNLCDDAHGGPTCPGSLTSADTWLKTVITEIQATAAYRSGDTLVEIVFDSGAANCGATCQSQVPAVLVNPQLNNVKLTRKYTHYSLLRLNEELLGLPLLGHAAAATDMRGALGF